jgi:hypothetical protein
MVTTAPAPYYDPYDFEIDADPYPVWKRLGRTAEPGGDGGPDRHGRRRTHRLTGTWPAPAFENGPLSIQ